MPQYVKSVSAASVYGRYDVHMAFGPGINIVHGVNGSGKTTLLHILANVLNGEYLRFVFLPFNTIKVVLDGGMTILVSRILEDDELQLSVQVDNATVLRLPVLGARSALPSERTVRRRVSIRERRGVLLEERLSEQDVVLGELERRLEGFEAPDHIIARLPAAYFPAFRTMIDAWASVPYDDEPARRRTWSSRATYFARRWFGQFVPSVNYPSLLEIEERLSEEVQRARITIGRADRKFLSQAFLDIFESLSEGTSKGLGRAEDILENIKSLFDVLEESPLQEESTLVTGVYAELSESIHDLHWADESERTAVRVLNVYRDLLEKVVLVQQESFKEIQQYLESVNRFLQGKEMMVDPSVPRYRGRSVGIQFGQGDRIERLRALSSGERQVATLIYAATHMSKQEVLLIDEPEISLHVDWQRKLIGEMSEQVGERQIIACTHSPSIGADYEDFQQEIELEPTREDLVVSEEIESDEIEEIPF